MPATATVELRYTDRAAINCANSQHSTGPRTETGKQRSSQNAIRHGLTARSAVLASEDQAAYENHCCQFQNEYQLSGVNYFFRSTTTILPDRRQLQALR
jgi:hypothetical protein